MGIITKELAGLLTITGLIIILALNLIFIQPLSFSLMLAGILLLTTIFLYNPSWGLFLFLFIRPALDSFSEKTSIRISEHLSVNAAAGLGLLIIILTVVFFLKNSHYIKKIPLKKFWGLYLGTIALSIFFSIEKMASLYEFLRLVSILCVFGLAFAVARHQKSLRVIFYAILSSAVIPAAVSFYQFLADAGITRSPGIESRIYGTFSHPNSFASFLLIIFALCLLGFFYYQNQENSKKEGSSEKKFYLLSSLFVFFLLLVTFSRGAWLALLIFSFFLSVFKNPKIILYAAGVLLLITLLFEPIQNRMQDLYNPPITGSVYWRMQQWTEMGGLFIQKPLTGYGAGTETIVHESEFGFYAGNPYTHNDLLKNALEAGVMGALTYVLLLVATSIKLFGFYWKSSSDQVKTFFLVILSLFIAEAAFGMSSNILRGTAAQWSLWALTGASLAIYSIKKPGKLG